MQGSGWRIALVAFAATLLYPQTVHAHCAYTKLNSTYMQQLCSTQPTADSSACTIYNVCINSTLGPMPFHEVCNISMLATKLCLDEPAVIGGVPECAHWKEHVLESVNITGFPACVASLGANSSIPVTSVVRGAAYNNCAAIGGAMPGCDSCTSNTTEGCPNPFYKLSVGCIDHDMEGCTDGGWKGFCSNEAAGITAGGQPQFGIKASVLCLPPEQRVPAPPAPPPATTLPSPPPVMPAV